MDARPRAKRLTFPLAMGSAAVLGCIFAVLVSLIPGETLESMVVDSGIAAIVSAAEPPLGLTARLALVLGVGAGVALFAWFGFFLIVGSRSLSFGPSAKEDGLPVLRRADAHPDAPPRRPLFAARDLGTPFLDVKAPPIERKIPTDLDQPISAFDPSALRADPMAMPEPVASLKRVVAEPVMPEAVLPEPVIAEPEAETAIAPEPTPLRRPATFESFERLETFELPVEPATASLETPSYAPIEPPVAEPVPEPAPIPAITPAPVADYPEAVSIHALLDRLERGARKRVAPPVLAPAPVAPPEPPRASNDSLQDALGALRRLATR